jgi:hypothetical protein
MVRQGQEPAEAVEVPVIGVAGGRARVGLRGELGPKPAQGTSSLLGERGDASPGHGRRSWSWLARRPALLSLRETKGDESDAAFDKKEVDGDLTDTPVVVRPRSELRVAHLFDVREESRAPFVRPIGQQPDSLTDPLRTVRGIIRYGERHNNAYCAVRV